MFECKLNLLFNKKDVSLCLETMYSLVVVGSGPGMFLMGLEGYEQH